ncbi:hypothetical protein [Victivallis sp. Marseille-Q1083]|uniref:hypothetical protein n=1 Tax=Victivallis sp. Marseille-Q1083 TaxID=2717288 RepID=UPI001589FD60|nr:hypothetical protein [Victivallis sp. Marseille-Q1083]
MAGMIFPIIGAKKFHIAGEIVKIISLLRWHRFRNGIFYFTGRCRTLQPDPKQEREPSR